MTRKTLRPGVLADGTPMIIPLPGKGRNVATAGEELTITPYIERRIAARELVEVVVAVKTKKSEASA